MIIIVCVVVVVFFYVFCFNIQYSISLSVSLNASIFLTFITKNGIWKLDFRHTVKPHVRHLLRIEIYDILLWNCLLYAHTALIYYVWNGFLVDFIRLMQFFVCVVSFVHCFRLPHLICVHFPKTCCAPFVRFMHQGSYNKHDITNSNDRTKDSTNFFVVVVFFALYHIPTK